MGHIPQHDEEDFRDFEWNFLYGLCPVPAQRKVFQWDDGLPAEIHQSWHLFGQGISRNGNVFAAIVEPGSKGKQRLAAWSTETGKIFWSTKLDFPVDRPRVTLSDDGKWVGVSAVGFGYWNSGVKIAARGGIHLWDISQNRKLTSITSEQLPVLKDDPRAEFEFRPGVQSIAIETAKKCLVMWDIENGSPVFEKKGIGTDYKFSPDGSLLAVLERRNQDNYNPQAEKWSDAVSVVRILDAETGEIINVLCSLTYLFSEKYEFSPDGKRLAMAARDQSEPAHNRDDFRDRSKLLIWDISSGALIASAEIKSNWAFVKFSRSGELIVVIPQSDAGTLRVHRAVDGSPFLQVENPHGGIVHFSSDERSLQTLDRTGMLWKWQLPISDFNVTLHADEPGQYAKLGGVSLSGDGKRLIRIPGMVSRRYFEETAQLFSLDGKMIQSLQLPWQQQDWGAWKMNHDGSLVVGQHANSADSEVTLLSVWNHEQNTIVGDLFESQPGEVLRLWQLSPTDSKAVGVITSSDESEVPQWQLRIWDQTTLQEERIDLVGEVSSIAFSKDGKSIAVFTYRKQQPHADGEASDSASVVGALTLYDAATGKVSLTMAIPGIMTNITLSQDSKFLAGNNTSPEDASLAQTEIWNLETEKQITVIKKAGLASVFSPNGKRLISMRLSDEEYWNEFSVWDTATGAPLLTRPMGKRGMQVFRFLPDTERLVAIFTGGAPKFWDGTPVELPN